MAAWRAVVRAYPCDTCGAQPGDPCTTPSGVPTAEHKARTHPVRYCPKCGTWVDGDPGQLCSRCQLLRDLNTERATTWKRRGQ
jgi:hypothetical protein